jgi:antirestriction protein ArdC
MAFNLYQTVTDQILASLQAGTAPWVKPWAATPGRNMPFNAATGTGYSGCNVILLWMATHGRFARPMFLTYKQALGLGGNVRKGEKSCATVVKVLQLRERDKTTGENTDRTFTSLKAYAVFNVEQCENLPAEIINPEAPKPRHDDERDATIEEFIAATGANFSETGGDRAFYQPSADCVRMPVFEAFKSAALYYSTAFHELGHWTGHATRCNRDFGKRFGTKAYAAEELVAELTSAFLCAEFSINGNLQHADYIGNWISLLKDDPRAFFTAASAAQKAADYMRGKMLAADEPLAIAA